MTSFAILPREVRIITVLLQNWATVTSVAVRGAATDASRIARHHTRREAK
jgi:hypothetical protein